MKNPFDVIKNRYITEKANVLSQLHERESNRSLARCQTPKYVFVVDKSANKRQIAEAVQTIYKEKNIKVVSVNTLRVQGKKKKRGRGRQGVTPAIKKAVVTLEAGDTLED